MRKWIFLLASVLLVGSCTKKEAPKQATIVPEVTVIKAVVRDIPLVKEYVGQISGMRDIQVRARVGGILLKRYYKEGSMVKAGDLLFKIDPAPYQATLDQARGVVSIEKARFDNARRSLNRTLPLYKENAVSQKDRDDAVAMYDGAKSSLESAKAKMREAEINLGYTTVVAPIDGYTSKETVSEGSLIVANSDQSLLTTISQLHPVYVNFSYTENEILQLRQQVEAGQLTRPSDTSKVAVQVRLSNGMIYDKKGFINFNDNIVDTTTGTVRARATLDNPDSILKPGQFVRVYVSGFTRKNAIAVPLKAILQTQTGPVLFIVDSGSKARQLGVELGEEIENEVVVTKGLKGGEQVIVEGAAKVRTGMPVKIVTGTSIASKR